MILPGFQIISCADSLGAAGVHLISEYYHRADYHPDIKNLPYQRCNGCGKATSGCGGSRTSGFGNLVKWSNYL